MENYNIKIEEQTFIIKDELEKNSVTLIASKGEKGDPGKDGYTPQKDVDYFTQEDIASLNIPTKTSQLNNDSGFITEYVESDPVFSASASAQITNQDITNWNAKSNFSGDYNDLENKPVIPTKISNLTNDLGFITNTVDNLTNYYLKTETYTKTEVNNLISQLDEFKVEVVQTLPVTDIDIHTIYLVPKNGSAPDVYDEYLYINNSWELIGNTAVDLSNYYTKSQTDTLLNNKADVLDIPTKTSDLTNDSDFMSGMTILAYGKSTWNDFITAYNNKQVVYCRASSNSNPASGSQTRMAFMAYVSNETTPTSVEFQYVRSISSHTDAQQGDQVFVYKLESTNGGKWTVTTREMSTRIVAGAGLTTSYNNGVLTISLA